MHKKSPLILKTMCARLNLSIPCLPCKLKVWMRWHAHVMDKTFKVTFNRNDALIGKFIDYYMVKK